GLLEALSACSKHRCLLGLGRAEEIAAILQEFRLNESTSRGIAGNLHHFRPFCFKPKRNGGNSCNFAGFPFWNRRPYRIAVFTARPPISGVMSTKKDAFLELLPISRGYTAR
ncbi:hypothetical protein, partial [Paenibacillus dendritiformis]|uniref:hypothetical protein n=1 Tax=Paenibacillus dendritiformis TaxID=130049 RepID=UPI001BCC95A2